MTEGGPAGAPLPGTPYRVGSDADPDYSPDGRYIAFSVSPQHHEGEDWDLAIMDAQKPGQFARVTTGPGNDRVPDWKPR